MELFCIKANPQWSTTPLTCPFMGSAEKTNVLSQPSRSGQHLKHHFHPSSVKRVPYTEAQKCSLPHNRVDPCTLKPLLPLSPVESLLEPSSTLLFSQTHGPTDTLNPASLGHKDRAPQTLLDLIHSSFPLYGLPISPKTCTHLRLMPSSLPLLQPPNRWTPSQSASKMQ